MSSRSNDVTATIFVGTLIAILLGVVAVTVVWPSPAIVRLAPPPPTIRAVFPDDYLYQWSLDGATVVEDTLSVAILLSRKNFGWVTAMTVDPPKSIPDLLEAKIQLQAPKLVRPYPNEVVIFVDITKEGGFGELDEIELTVPYEISFEDTGLSYSSSGTETIVVPTGNPEK